ncbi:ABC transporter permease, partial [Actinotalea sp. JY-7885]
RVAERLGARGRGAVGPLAAWEVGRRSTRATAAVLLLTLALAVGTFSQTFLATWRQSQLDQAQLATAAAVVVQDADPTSAQATALSAPDVTDAVPQPTARRDAELAPADVVTYDGVPDGRPVRLLALTAESRAMLDRGRMGRVSGTDIAALEVDLPSATGLALPDDARGLSAVVRVGDATEPVPVVALVRAVVEDAGGLLSTVSLGSVPFDGTDHRLDALLPAGLRTPAQVVGWQTSLLVVDQEAAEEMLSLELRAVLSLAEISALLPDPAAPPADAPADDADAAAAQPPGGAPDLATLGLLRAPLDVPAETDWTVLGVSIDAVPTEPLPGTQVAVRVNGLLVDLLLAGVATVTQTVWDPVGSLPVVLSSGLAENLRAQPGTGLQLVLDTTVVRVVVADVVPRVPTLVREESVVVDHTQLARAIAQAGGARTPVDEWWLDVAPDDVPAYLAGLPALPDGEPGARRATAQVEVTDAMLQHPLRVATQAALWLVTGAAAALAAVGFAVHATVSLRSRSVEFAQLRAIGLTRGRLTGVVALESLLLGTLGAGFGIALGTLLGHLVGPLVAVSATGTRPVPTVLVEVPWGQVALLALEVVAVLAVVVLVVARTQRSADPAGVMRLGDER